MGAQLPTEDDVRRVVREELERILAVLAPPGLVSVEEAAGILGVSIDTVRRRIRAREIPVRRVGRLIRIERAALGARAADVVDLAARTRGR